jgi:hypothetical protein
MPAGDIDGDIIIKIGSIFRKARIDIARTVLIDS